MRYRLTKLTDDKFKGKHPNGILQGFVYNGHITSKPKIGERFHFGTHQDHPKHHLWTSVVTKIIKYNKEIVFKTENSTYKLLKIKNESKTEL